MFNFSILVVLAKTVFSWTINLFYANKLNIWIDFDHEMCVKFDLRGQGEKFSV